MTNLTIAQSFMTEWHLLPRYIFKEMNIWFSEQDELDKFIIRARGASIRQEVNSYKTDIGLSTRDYTFTFVDNSRLKVFNVEQVLSPVTAEVL